MTDSILQTQKNVFLDVGGNYCQGLANFVSNILHIDDTWEVHTFEPNPSIDTKQLIKDKGLDGLNITIHNNAAWIEDTTKSFKLLKNHEANLLEGVIGEASQTHAWGCLETIQVSCFDFYKFVTSFNKTDRIFIKMDIEWSEYDILENMLQRGWPSNIVEMWVEFHGMGHEQFNIKSEELINKITSQGTTITRWT